MNDADRYRQALKEIADHTSGPLDWARAICIANTALRRDVPPGWKVPEEAFLSASDDA